MRKFPQDTKTIFLQEDRMSQEYLRDRLGNKIGKIVTQSDGKLVLYSRLNERLGTYNPRDNITKDRLGRVVGKGNLLTTLLQE